MKANILKDKSYSFALRIIKLFQFLSAEKKEFVLSKSDFIHKLAISNTEAFETYYWLKLLCDSEILKPKLAESLMIEGDKLQ